MNAQTREMNPAGERHERQGTAVIVGASLSGLMTGLALSRAGVDVTMLERVDEFPRTGASLGLVHEGLCRHTRSDFPPTRSRGQ
jgi:glycine/D-amino acid oxidase-like deaminating enzyme